jgi:hypothetical protein
VPVRVSRVARVTGDYAVLILPIWVIRVVGITGIMLNNDNIRGDLRGDQTIKLNNDDIRGGLRGDQTIQLKQRQYTREFAVMMLHIWVTRVVRVTGITYLSS